MECDMFHFISVLHIYYTCAYIYLFAKNLNQQRESEISNASKKNSSRRKRRNLSSDFSRRFTMNCWSVLILLFMILPPLQLFLHYYTVGNAFISISLLGEIYVFEALSCLSTKCYLLTFEVVKE